MAYLGIDLHPNNFRVASLETLGKEGIIEESKYTMEEESNHSRSF